MGGMVMTREDKELLLRDICARLPYKVKAYIKNWSKLDQKYYEGTYIIESIHPSLNNIYAFTKNSSVEVILGHTDYVIKPYLFPLSSISEEQKEELKNNLRWNFDKTEIHNLIEDFAGNYREYVSYSDCTELIDWLIKNHFDYRGLIPKGLANDATGLNIY